MDDGGPNPFGRADTRIQMVAGGAMAARLALTQETPGSTPGPRAKQAMFTDRPAEGQQALHLQTVV